MRHVAVFSLLAAALVLMPGCGSGTSPNLSGNWVGQTASSAGGGGVSFTFTMAEGAPSGSAAPVNITNLTFQAANNCFPSIATATAEVASGNPRTLTGFVYSAPNNTGNQLSFNTQVALDNNSASGTYNLVGGTGNCPTNDFGSINLTRQ